MGQLTDSTFDDSALQMILQGDRLAVSRGITAIENERHGWQKLLSGLHLHSGKAYRIGITGPPGAGKSTLTQKLIIWYRQQGMKVAVIAVDPTSPFTGGAILGDRVRIGAESLHPDVFLRSMATRGSLGGLCIKAQDVADLLDAAGFDVILIETVGVGQSELDIAKATDTTVVVLVPESGDSIQAMKSGLMEIADLFVLNKSDRDGAEQAVAALKTILSFRITHADDEWIPEVVRTVATTAQGIQEVGSAIEAHRQYMLRTGFLETRRRARQRDRVMQLIDDRFRHTFWTQVKLDMLEERLPLIAGHKISPLQAAVELMA